MDKQNLLNGIRVLYHSSVRLEGEKVIYTDPFELSQAPHDADIILITHDHYDHFSLEDIEKIKGPETILVAPENMRQQALAAGFDASQVILVEPDRKYSVSGLTLETVPAYNVDKRFHPRAQRWVGYILQMNGLRYYIAGDTDGTEENQRVQCDVALLPVGGTYTMDARQAAKLANQLKPQAAVPTHYGAIVGDKEDGQLFCQLLAPEIHGAVLLER